MRDSQRQAVYDWEREVEQVFGLQDSLSLRQCEELIARVWDDYRPGCSAPVLKDGRGTRYPRGGRLEISLPVRSRRTVIVLHEIAHSIKITDPWHSREFATLLLDLLVHYAGVPRQKVRTLGVHQKPRRVRFAPAANVPQQTSRKWRAWEKQWRIAYRAYQAIRGEEPSKYRKH